MYIKFAYIYLREAHDIIIICIIDTSGNIDFLYYDRGSKLDTIDGELKEKAIFINTILDQLLERDKLLSRLDHSMHETVFTIVTPQKINEIVSRISTTKLHSQPNHLLGVNSDYITDIEDRKRNLDMCFIFTHVRINSFITSSFFTEDDNKLTLHENRTLVDNSKRRIKVYKGNFKLGRHIPRNSISSSRSIINKAIGTFATASAARPMATSTQLIYPMQETISEATLSAYFTTHVIKVDNLVTTPVPILYDPLLKYKGEKQLLMLDGNHKMAILKALNPDKLIPSIIMIPDFLKTIAREVGE